MKKPEQFPGIGFARAVTSRDTRLMSDLSEISEVGETRRLAVPEFARYPSFNRGFGGGGGGASRGFGKGEFASWIEMFEMEQE